MTNKIRDRGRQNLKLFWDTRYKNIWTSFNKEVILSRKRKMLDTKVAKSFIQRKKKLKKKIFGQKWRIKLNFWWRKSEDPTLSDNMVNKNLKTFGQNINKLSNLVWFWWLCNKTTTMTMKHQVSWFLSWFRSHWRYTVLFSFLTKCVLWKN